MAFLCKHERLVADGPAQNLATKYQQPPADKRVAATILSGRAPKLHTSVQRADMRTYPAPLVLPGDELDLDPKCPPQPFRSWAQLKERNHVTKRSNTIYLAAAPFITKDVQFLHDWHQPLAQELREPADPPHISSLVEYIRAFYHGMNIKLVGTPFQYTAWDTTTQNTKRGKNYEPAVEAITLETDQSGTRIRVRPCPDETFGGQLNLDDLLDACIDALPEDAYAFLLMVDHDLYEDEEDDFCCGRAYGGSRVAVVSSARYHPGLDDELDVDHAWPASHCSTFVDGKISNVNAHKRKTMGGEEDENGICSPLRLAVDAHHSLPAVTESRSHKVLSGLWLGRVCRTASHELGHCLGIGHCVYYACVMQGTASIEEDSRQPPYLCPVDMAKIVYATGATEVEWCQAMLQLCRIRADIHLFFAFGAWLKARLQQSTTTRSL